MRGLSAIRRLRTVLFAPPGFHAGGVGVLVLGCAVILNAIVIEMHLVLSSEVEDGFVCIVSCRRSIQHMTRSR